MLCNVGTQNGMVVNGTSTGDYKQSVVLNFSIIMFEIATREQSCFV